MIYRTLPKIEKPMSAICLGTAFYGSQVDEFTSNALMDRFVKLNGNFIDTGHVYGAWDKNGTNGGYGNSEVVIGRWMKSNGNRDKLILGTKGAHPDFETKASCMTQKMILQHLHESLDHLQTDYIDIYWLHRDDRSVPVEDIMSWLEEPCRQGLIKTIGCSHWRPDRLAEAIDSAKNSSINIVGASQIAWSYAKQKNARSDGPYGEQLAMDDETLEFHIQSQLPLVAYNSQAAGFFAKKYDNIDLTKADSPELQKIAQYINDENLARRAKAQKFAKEHGCSTNQVALSWLLNQKFPTFALVGPSSIEHLDDSMGASYFKFCSDGI